MILVYRTINFLQSYTFGMFQINSIYIVLPYETFHYFIASLCVIVAQSKFSTRFNRALLHTITEIKISELEDLMLLK